MRTLSLFGLLFCAACSASGPPAAQTPLAQIHALIGAAACTESAQCKTLPIGASACGGPDSYLAYSVATTPDAPLRELAMRHAQQRNAELMKSGEAGACAFLVDPGAQCRAGACVLNAAPAPGKPRLRPPPEA